MPFTRTLSGLQPGAEADVTLATAIRLRLNPYEKPKGIRSPWILQASSDACQRPRNACRGGV